MAWAGRIHNEPDGEDSVSPTKLQLRTHDPQLSDRQPFLGPRKLELNTYDLCYSRFMWSSGLFSPVSVAKSPCGQIESLVPRKEVGAE